MSVVFGVGIGLIILILTWALTLGICIIASKYQNVSYMATTAFVLSTCITIFLFCVPRDPPDFDKKTDIHVYDTLLTWRIILIVLLSISCVIGMSLVLPHLLEPVYAKRIKVTEKWTVVND